MRFPRSSFRRSGRAPRLPLVPTMLVIALVLAGGFFFLLGKADRQKPVPKEKVIELTDEFPR